MPEANLPRHASIPHHASVVVIGGGIMGCSTLYHLTKSGVRDAVLIERNKLTSGTTWHSAAQVRALRSTRNLTDLIRYSISLYAALEEEVGQHVGWINKGSLSIATSPDRLTHIKRQAALAHLFGVRAETISSAEAAERWPLMRADDILGAVWSPDDGRVSPSDLCAALARGAKSNGGRIFEDTAITGIETQGGRIKGVETSQGAITCDAVAVCAGLWSREVAAMAGAEAPLWPCEHFYLLTKPVGGVTGNLPTLSDHDRHLYIRDDSGGLLVGCFEPRGKPIAPERLGADFAFQLLPEDWDHFEPMMVNALHRLPVLEEAEVRMLLNGPESFTPDGSFLLGETAETRGLFLGCGMNSVGVATGGGAGMALAHAIIHGTLPMDLHEADPKRFDTSVNSVEALTVRAPEVLGAHYEIAYPNRQWQTARGLKTLPLHDRWVAAGAHFGQVFGYERPLYFGALTPPRLTFGTPDWFDHVAAEVRIAAIGAAITELSSFGRFDIIGTEAEANLNHIMTASMDKPPGHVIYTLMLNERGGVVSDLTVMRLAHDHFRLTIGSGAVKRDYAWINNHLDRDSDTRLVDRSLALAGLGLMGPEADAIATALGGGWMRELGYFRHGYGVLAGVEVLAGRLSYIGCYGWELVCARADTARLYDALAGAGGKPIGGLAMTSMRIEKRFHAYGHDLDTDMTPAMAGLEFTLAMGGDFIGREALAAANAPIDAPANAPARRLVSLKFAHNDANPIGHEPVMQGKKMIGAITSAAYGYRVGRPVALALIESDAAADNTEVLVNIAGDMTPATVIDGAAYDPEGRIMRPASGYSSANRH